KRKKLAEIDENQPEEQLKFIDINYLNDILTRLMDNVSVNGLEFHFCYQMPPD
ncbi:9801_t:CDS:1, partial [Scutellospora calospora]